MLSDLMVMQLFNRCQTTANRMIELMNGFLKIAVVPGEIPSFVNQRAAEEGSNLNQRKGEMS